MSSRKLTRSIIVGVTAIAIAGVPQGSSAPPRAAGSSTSHQRIARCPQRPRRRFRIQRPERTRARRIARHGQQYIRVGLHADDRRGPEDDHQRHVLHDLRERRKSPASATVVTTRQARPQYLERSTARPSPPPRSSHTRPATPSSTAWRVRLLSFQRRVRLGQKTAGRSRRTTPRGRAPSPPARKRTKPPKPRSPPTRRGRRPSRRAEQRRLRSPQHRRQLAAPCLPQPRLQSHQRRATMPAALPERYAAARAAVLARR